MKKKKKIIFLCSMTGFFLIYFVSDFLNIPSLFGIKFSNINSDLFGIIVNSLVVIVLYIITYWEIDCRQLKKDENAQKTTYTLLLRSYKTCLTTINTLNNKTVLKQYIVSKIDFDKSEKENHVLAELKNSPFDSYEHILSLSENGHIEELRFNKYLKIKDDYRNYITFCIVFFDLDSIELNDDLKELKKNIFKMKDDLINELQEEIAFIEKMIKPME